MSSLCLPKLRRASALAFIATAIFVACGVPDYKVPAAQDAGVIIPAGTGGKPSTSSGGSTSNAGSSSVVVGTGGAPQLPNNCTSNANCAGLATKICNTATNKCLECLTTSDCGPGLYCSTTDFNCHVGCDSNDACGSVACDASKCPALTCDLTAHQCKGCTGDADCKVGTECNAATGACVPACAGAADCPTGWLCCGGACSNPQLDADHCSNCATSCAQTEANVRCFNGKCEITTCKDGYGDCDTSWSTGCEVDLLSSAANCGVCKSGCATDQVCINGKCGSQTCTTPGVLNCDNSADGSCEVNTLREPLNCGGCGNKCSTINATPTCDNGTCTLSCKSGFEDCNAKVVDGCEVELATSAAHCGSCTNACANDHGNTTCAAGQCVPTCVGSFGDCDNDKSNGCEANLATDPAHCGTCGPCTLASATAACTAGSCTIASCSPNTADCDGTASNGCETNLQTTPAHCGTCATACNATNGTATCATGQCGITCTAGYSNCDGNVANGCEVDLTKSVDHCGTCATVCPDQANGTATCVASVCGISNCKTPYGDCDQVASNGCEANENSDPNNCSGCGNKCVIPHATPKCTLGVCGISTCDTGWADCDGNVTNGCEVNLKTDINNCNACGSLCAPANAVGACVAGACTIASCKGNFQNCDINGANATNGCEADITTSAGNCGACGTACSTAHGTPSCSAGVCNITCAAGYGNCDGNVANGCEAATTNNVANCGTCGTTCVTANGTAACLNSACTVSACNTGFYDCDAKYSNGCEANLNTDLSNCGACSNVCNSTSGVAACAAGKCGITCTSGYGNCDTQVANGCEINLATSLQNCGVCGQACAPANAAGACGSGNCSISTCNIGFANCNALVGDGCEVNLTSDASNCNSCGTVCSFAHATAGCASGTCTLGACAAGYANCDSAAANGCEVTLATDPAHCGTCSTVCAYTNAAATCSSGTCAIGSCNAGFANCDAVATNGCEVNLNSDVNNCGGCGAAFKCPTTGGTPVCTNGVCGYSSCGAGLATCPPGGTCATNTTNDVNNCAGCGTKCIYANAAASCASSTCAIGACTAGYGNCDNTSANGCEVNLKTDANNCNTCGTKCTFANAAASCVNGACTMGACNTGYANCDGLASNGCEVNLNTDANNCNACGTKCNTTNGTATCSAGTCQIACNVGYANCDLSTANGCEINTNTSTANCGACGTVCNSANGTATCSTGTCGITCNGGYGNCDGSAANGCEINTATNVNYCGSCSNVCGSAHGTPGCAAGSCSIACAAGYGNCDANFSNGCEAVIASDASNCGSCGTRCTYANASGVCSSSACQMGTCNSGYGNCNSNATDGCEISLATTSNCGTCGNSCTNSHGTTACTAGACAPSCSTGYLSCDSNAANGCEQLVSTDVNHCGSCTTVCSYANATPVCSSNACSMGACTYLYGNCDGSAANGCEKPLAADTSNCGACGTACGTANGTPSCSGGACSIACTANYLNCDSVNSNGCEINRLTDANNCGTCGNVCAYGCTNGVCNGPCAGICSNPINLTISGSTCTFGTNPAGTCGSPALGTAAICYQTTGAISGGGCSNFTGGRTLSVNGVVEPCDGSWTWPLPATLNGGYCIAASAGNYSYAAFNLW